MPINNITQTISTIPPAGARGVDVQTQFVIKQEDFQDHLQGTTVTELNTLKDQLNTRIGEINSTVTTMSGYADTASAGASTATTKAGEAATSASAALTSRNQASTFATNSSNSATKASQWADNNYNVEVEAGKYSAKHWSTVAQNTVSGKVEKVTSTDNAIVRFDGVTGAVQNSGVVIDDSGNVGGGTQSFNGFGGSGFKNHIINGNFDIWQRGTNFSGLTNGMYSADRWVVYDTVGDISYNVIRNAAVFQGGYGATYAWNSGTGTRSITQFIENVTKFKVGTQVTLSFEAYTNSTPYTIDVAIQGVRGVWAASTAEAASSIALTNTKTKYSVTLTVPDLTPLGIDWAHLEDTKLACKFNISSSTNGKDFIISNVQLEEGSVATPFEQRPYGLELSLCQRYYQVYGDSTQGINIIGYSIAGQTERTSFMFPIQMRDNPNATRVGTWYAGNCSQPTIAAKSKNGFSLQTIVAATGGFEYTCNGTGQYLIFEKEL